MKFSSPLEFDPDHEYEWNGFSINLGDPLIQGLVQWANYGLPQGDFLSAILRGDLNKAVHHGSIESLSKIVILSVFVYNRLPSGCSGDWVKLHEWQDMGGLKGLEERQRELDAKRGSIS